MDSSLAVIQLKKIQKLIKGKEMRLAGQWESYYNILIATILSAVTRDETTIKVCEKLFKKYPTMFDLATADQGEVKNLIKPINFYINKTRNILATANILKNKPIPKLTNELIKLPGIGRKVANVYLAEAHKADVIGVDTHVSRISQKLNWTTNTNPDKIEKDLENLFPKKYWIKINETLVIFGKSYGLSRKKEDDILKNL